MQIREDDWWLWGMRERVHTGAQNYYSEGENKCTYKKPNWNSLCRVVHFFPSETLCYQKIIFSTTNIIAITAAQKIGRLVRGKWPSDGISVQP